MKNLRLTSFLLSIAALGTPACGADLEDGASGEDLGALSQPITTLTISGRVRDASGAGIAGVTVTLAGKAEGTRVTDATGSYSFTSLAAGSYSLRPTRAGCSITPDVVNLNNLKANKTVNFTGAGSGCSAVPPRALMLVDPRLKALLSTELEQYRAAASARRGFAIELRAVSGIDDFSPAAVRSYVAAEKAANPTLEGVLYVGNIKLPSFYKNRADILDTRLYPAYYEDLDATFAKNQAAGTVDPVCDGTNDDTCTIHENVIVPEHDLDYMSEGPSPGPELWAAFMPVGVAGTGNTYADFANQLRPYLTKVLSFYSGQLAGNGRYYFVSNDMGGRFDLSWSAFGPASIDFYGRPGPQGQTGDACLVNGQNLCYQRWNTESFATVEDFIAHYQQEPWVDENWQTAEVLISHMNANLYDVVEVHTHGSDTWAVVDSDEARAMTGGGLVVAIGGCNAAGFYQPGSTSYVNSGTAVSENLTASYLYGSSKFLAGLSTAHQRVHYANHPYIYRELKVSHAYLGAAHRVRMHQNYAEAYGLPYNLKDEASEMLMGDPFLDLD